MDIEMPEMNGVEATSEVKKRYPHIKILMLTVLIMMKKIFKSIKAGADGYLLKEINPQNYTIPSRKRFLEVRAMTPSIALKTLKLLREPQVFETEEEKKNYTYCKRNPGFGTIEQRIKIRCYCRKSLILSKGTIRKHVENIYAKLQVHNKLEAVQIAKK